MAKSKKDKGKKKKNKVVEDVVSLVMLPRHGAKKIEGMYCYLITDSKPWAKRKYPEANDNQELWSNTMPGFGKMLVTSQNEKRLIVYIPVGIRGYQRRPYLEALQAETKPITKLKKGKKSKKDKKGKKSKKKKKGKKSKK